MNGHCPHMGSGSSSGSSNQSGSSSGTGYPAGGPEVTYQ
jgi:hypothetical protein